MFTDDRSRHRATSQHDEPAALHSITSSARASSVGGIITPSALAVLRLMTNSNLVACTTGNSASYPLEGVRETLHVRFGSKVDICDATAHVRFTPNSDRKSGLPRKVVSALPPKADMFAVQLGMSALGHKRTSPYSITSSARASSIGGTVRPMALPVLRLTISSNLVGCSTGRSLGLAPLKILSTNVAMRR
jgi:hypothetical protein